MDKDKEIKLDRTWFPESHQLVVGENDAPYSHSVWVGLTTPIINLPVMIFRHVIMPFLNGIFFVIQFTFQSMLSGLLGRAEGLLVDMPQITIRIVSMDEFEKIDKE